MTADKQAKILARVRKMMKLANDANATEGERDNAMRAAHATLAKYNLTLSQVGNEDASEAREKLAQPFLGKPWCINIAGAIARLYFCNYFYQTMGGNAGPTQKALHSFVGRHSNVVTAQEMARFVVESVNREAQRYQRSIDGRYADYRAFAQGAAAKIRQRCLEIQKHAETRGVQETNDHDEAADPKLLPAYVPGTALVLASLYKNEEEANEAFMKNALGIDDLKPGRSQSVDLSKMEARRAGVQYGSKVSLHQQVGRDTTKRLK